MVGPSDYGFVLMDVRLPTTFTREELAGVVSLRPVFPTLLDSALMSSCNVAKDGFASFQPP